ncbi:hypothetical protein SUGI_0793970 [Cryptomeria japonica]|uniref:uncharacterized protein LOC131078550 isoform X2 n=1 Tax=Cryptomeria japonica TaxID=3369 RepID=UPI0024149B35|nr:uncharacterized protein LOC131078550 isoform X2 [Cryptomeria japonica]GLJ38943.1 hypothetical protein SUGI_0793970 [Cryptomeria japonica]
MPEGELTNHLWTSFKLEETSSEEKQRGKGEEKREGIGDEKHGSFWEQISSVTKEVKVSPVSKESKEIMEVSSGIGGRTQQRRQKKRWLLFVLGTSSLKQKNMKVMIQLQQIKEQVLQFQLDNYNCKSKVVQFMQ